MNFPKKTVFSFLICFFLLALIFPGLAFGATGEELIKGGLDKAAETAGGQNVQKGVSLQTFIGRAINGLFAIIGIIFLGMAVVGGVLWMMAGGSEEKVLRAKKFIIGGVEGLIIMSLSYAMVYLVLQALRAGVSN
ncbi:hypothetical protein HYZ76_01370 [Candidatus Falkowbacteria bacterium]|nr:hypothetical protein [Candidatus Falkowbacteria bacterium]